MFKPTADNVILEKDDDNKETTGGILLPDQFKPMHSEGTVIAVGPGKVTERGIRVEPEISPGDRVVFNPYSGIRVDREGKEYFSVRQEAVIAIVK